MSIVRVEFENFKALAKFRLNLQQTNVLVGPNNSGKSTIIGAFRVLAAGLRIAARTTPKRLPYSDRERRTGYRIPPESIPISLENAQTDYSDRDAFARFMLSNQLVVTLQFRPGHDDVQMFVEVPEGTARVDTPGRFRDAVPLTVTAVPILGPVEHDEPLVQEATVRRNVGTHRASRNFRNYWRYNLDSFAEFRELISETWPGMDVEFPTVDHGAGLVHMFCIEQRMPRELYWVGFGFQAWCQFLTHTLAARGSFVVIDEPELYLHPDLQRRLIDLLHERANGFVIATHSPEIVTESDPSEIVLIDRRRVSSRRLNTARGSRDALASLGSRQVFALTTIARARLVLFVENASDFALLRQFAEVVGARNLAKAHAVTAIPLDGHRPDLASAMGQAIRQSLETDATFALLVDRDFRSTEEAGELLSKLEGFRFAQMLRRKEIENYLLDPAAVTAAVRAGQERRKQHATLTTSDVQAMISEIAEDFRIPTQVQYVDRWASWRIAAGASSSERPRLHERATRDFEGRWEQELIALVPGKAVLAALRSRIQNEFGVTITTKEIISQMSAANVPDDLRQNLQQLERLLAQR